MTDKKKLIIKANELTEVDVSAISLVKNAANRSPFKILKSVKGEKMNMDLSRLFRMKKAESPPAVVCYVTKAEHADKLTEMLKSDGVEVCKTEEKEGMMLLHVIDEAPTDLTTIKMNDDVAVMVSDVSKSFNAYESESDNFVNGIAIQGFFPGVRTAADVFVETLYNIMSKSEAGVPPMQQIQKLATDFGEYVNTLASRIPIEAFKCESMVMEVKKDEVPAVVAPVVAPVEAVAPVVPPTEPIVPVAEVAVDNVAPVSVPPVVAVTKSEVESMVSDEFKKVTKTLEETMAAFVSKQDATVTAMTESFAKLQEALRGVVNVTPNADTRTVSKTENGGTFDNVLNFDGF